MKRYLLPAVETREDWGSIFTDVSVDFGDARVGAKEYEWPPLWIDSLHRDIEAMRIFLSAYAPSMVIDQEFLQWCLTWTLLHDFGSDIIATALGQANSPPAFSSLEEFQEFLWPSSLIG